MVKKRVEEELEKRKDEIEAEVTRRVEAAKVQMEREMMLELEKRREQARLEEQKREVNIFNDIDFALKKRRQFNWISIEVENTKSVYFSIFMIFISSLSL